MSDVRRVPFSIETFLKRSWPLLAIGIVLVFGLAGVLFHYAIAGQGRMKTTSASIVAETPSSTTPETTLIPRKLDGIPVLSQEASLQPFAVMVENSPDARPLSGISAANLVIEAPVEGGITRFMAVFDATTTVDQIGPVRSARPYFVELADGLNAIYAHVGGSPEALQDIHAFSDFRDLDQFYNAKYFWRSAKRDAPHNVYTRMDVLREAIAAKAWSSQSFKGWAFLDGAATSSARGTVDVISVPYGGTFNVTWKYDPETNSYTRFQAGAIQKDSDGAVVRVLNVVVLLSEQQVLDEAGRLRVRTTGSGKARLFHDGRVFEGTWHRQAGAWLSFEGIDGADMTFEPGTTWVSIVTSPAMFPAGNGSSATSTAL